MSKGRSNKNTGAIFLVAKVQPGYHTRVASALQSPSHPPYSTIPQSIHLSLVLVALRHHPAHDSDLAMVATAPKLLVNPVVWRLLPAVVLGVKVAVVLLDLAPLLLGQLRHLRIARHALVGDLGLRRRVLGRAAERLAPARAALCAAPGEPVDDARAVVLGVLLLVQPAGGSRGVQARARAGDAGGGARCGDESCGRHFDLVR